MSTANAQGHPGLSFGPVAGLRRGGYPPPGHLPPSNKPAPSLSQHASPYQPQAYTPQQPSQGQYPHHLFNPTAPQIPGVASVQNAARQPPPQGPPTLPGPRQRAPPPRQQMQQQQNPPLGYLQQSLNQQHMPQQPMNPQQLSQQSMGQQSLGQQSMNQQSMSQQPMSQQPMSQQPMSQQSMSQQSMNQQPLGQPSLSQQQPMSQQLHLQPMSQPPMTQSMSQQQSLSQSAPQNDNSILSQQSTPRSTVQPSLPPAAPQLPQIQQVQKVQQVQQVQQQPTPPQPEPAEPTREDDMEMGSPDELGEGDSSLEPKLIDGAPFVPREPMGPMMSAPPEGGSFPTLEAVHKHVLGYCTSVGYAIVIGRSKKTVPGLKKVLFVCDRAGKPPKRVSPEMRKRKTTSRKCDCQFGFFAIEQRTQWTVRYRPNACHLQHNHGPSESPLLHPAARKLDTKMVQAVKNLKESGIGVTQTLEILQQDNPHVPLLPRDIYNARAAINRNPTKVNAALAEDRPAIYSKPHPSPEDRIRADLRKEIQKLAGELDQLRKDSQKEIADLKAKLKEKDQMIEKFEQFIDICNQRVIVRLADNANGANGPASTNA